MAIIDTQLKSRFGYGGRKPSKFAGSDPQSTLHNTSSINNKPAITKQPSNLDLDGKTPARYLDNPPR
jgi:hypothetical protein